MTVNAKKNNLVWNFENVAEDTDIRFATIQLLELNNLPKCQKIQEY